MKSDDFSSAQIVTRPLPDLSLQGGFKKVFRLSLEFCEREKSVTSPVFGMKKVKLGKKLVKYLASKSRTTTFEDALIRLRHIPNAKQILESSMSIFEKRTEFPDSVKYSLLGQIEGGKILKVVVIENLHNKEFSVQTIYEVTKSITNSIGPHINQAEYSNLPSVLSKPILKASISESKSVSGRVVLFGQLSSEHYNIVLYTGNELKLVEFSKGIMPVIRMGALVEISNSITVKNKLTNGRGI